MAILNATTGIDNLLGDNADDDIFNIGTGTVQAGDLFRGRGNLLGGIGDLVNLIGTGTFDFTGTTFQGFERLTFSAQGDVILDETSNQYGGGLISAAVITGVAGSSQTITINNITGDLALGLVFADWDSGEDMIFLNGTAGNETISGSNGQSDTIRGGAGLDMLYGRGGDDTFILVAGDEQAGELIHGGAGQDTLRVEGGGTVDFSGMTFVAVENVVLADAEGTRVVVSQATIDAFAGTLDATASTNDTLAITDFAFLGTFGTPATRAAAFQLMNDLFDSGVENVEWQEGGATNVATRSEGVVLVTSTDNGGANWSTGTFTFDAVTGNRIQKITNMDDGSSIRRDFSVETDSLSYQAISNIVGSQNTIETTYAPSGLIAFSQTINDNGTGSFTVYDEAGRVDSQAQMALNGVVTTTYFNDANRRIQVVQTDASNAVSGWREIITDYDPSTQQITGKITFDDIGNVTTDTYTGGVLQSRVTEDAGGTNDPWSTITNTYVGGVFSSVYHQYDNGGGMVQGSANGDKIGGATGYNDALIGNGGADTFVFSVGGGNDRALDFNRGQGDLLDLRQFGIATVDDLEAAAVSITQSGANLVVNLGGGDSIQINGQSMATLMDSDFVLLPS